MELEEFGEKPVYCFTSDTDWASEEQIEFLMNVFKEHHITVTPFLTHASEVIRRLYSDKRNLVGLHPNFLPGSSHGANYEEVVSNAKRLWPESVFFRSHSFFDNTHIGRLVANNGFKFDANLLLFLQNGLFPLKHNSGLLRFPTAWEDDIHFYLKLPMSISCFGQFLDSPGLKIFNFHPVHVFFNTPDDDFYAAIKRKEALHPFKGNGTMTILTELLQWIENRSVQTYTLPELYEACRGSNQLETASYEKSLPEYDSAGRELRAEMVKARYDSKQPTNKYATSRDFNLRELEIEFIRSSVAGSKRLLDLGCGNGYTLLTLARTIQAEMIGIDFSDQMIKGASKLAQHMYGQTSTNPRFELGDVRKLNYVDGTFDAVISERCLLNLPSREDQYLTLREIHRVLGKGGRAILVEGTLQGLERLNTLRVSLGLEAIPDRTTDNFSALKFDEVEFEARAKDLFTVEKKHDFGIYYLISRVVHPLLVSPKEPQFDAKINEVARKVATVLPSYRGLGHVVGYVLRKDR